MYKCLCATLCFTTGKKDPGAACSVSPADAQKPV